MSISIFWVLVPYIWVCLFTSGNCQTKNDELSLAHAGHVEGCENSAEQLEKCEKQSQSEIQFLKTELRTQKQRIDDLERLVLTQMTRVDNREKTLQPDVEIASIDGEDKDKSQSENICTVANSLDPGDIEGQRSRRQGNEITVAFYARLSNHIQHAGPNQTVDFDHVITNVGAAYSNTLGAFIAPVPGLYLFSVSLMAYHSESEHFTLSKNSQPIAYMFARAFESPYMNTGHTAILQLTKGDNVEIQFRDVDGSLHGGYSAFAGFLLQQDYGYTAVVGK